ncbi:MAG: hypothetical protein Q9M89_08485 [Persephonella sp.]|nr:hypothetical protein [Persephonella sp.]
MSYPISIWIPTGEAKPENVKISLKEIAERRGFSFRKGKVKRITANTVSLENGEEIKDFDYLVVALGQQKLKHKGIEHTLSVCGSPEEIIQIKERLASLIKRGEGRIAFGFGGNPKAPEAVRGGPVFEMMFNVHNYLKKRGIRDRFELTFFAPMEKPGARLGEKALKMMDMMFKSMNINKITGKKIKEFREDGVMLEEEWHVISLRS